MTEIKIGGEIKFGDLNIGDVFSDGVGVGATGIRFVKTEFAQSGSYKSNSAKVERGGDLGATTFFRDTDVFTLVSRNSK